MQTIQLTKKSEFEFWVIAGEADDCKLVAQLAQKLRSSCSVMVDVERCDKVTARTRTKVSNRKLDSTTEAYCKIAVSESNRRHKAQVPNLNAVQALRSRLCNLTKPREESASAAEAIAEARRAGDGDADLEVDEHAELDLLLDEVLDELGDEFVSSDEEL